MKRMVLAGLAVDMSSGAPVVVLRELDEPHRVLPIMVGHPEAASIALALGDQVPPHPLAHDVMATLVQRLEGRVDAAEITGVRGGSFVSSLAVHGPSGDHRLDVRPSDAIALAVRLGAPLLVSDDVLDAAGTLLAPQPDDAGTGTGAAEPAADEVTIDAAVDEFRAFLDDIEPSDFGDQPDDAGDAGGHAA